MKKAIFLFLCIVWTTGCAPFQNLSMSDVRQPNRLKRQGYIQKSIHEIDDCIGKHLVNCGSMGHLTYSDEARKNASYIAYGIGLTQANPYVIIDLQEESPNRTHYKGYTAISTYNKFIDDFVVNVNACGRCPD